MSQENQRVLVVEPDVHAAQAFVEIMRGEGFAVDVAPHAEGALSLAEAGQYALVAAEGRLEEGDGLELIDSLQGLQPDASFMMVGEGCDLPTVLSAFHDHGVSFVVGRPWDGFELARLAHRAMDAHWERATQRQVQRSMVDASRQLGAQRQRLEATLTQGHARLTEALLGAFAMRGHETEAHCRRLARHALTLAEAAGLSGRVLVDIEQGALLHDIGKIGIPDAILLKAGPLTAAEWSVVRGHPEMGARLLEGMDYLQGPRDIVRQHQERFDGSGYPGGLAGQDICIGARIFAPCDALDAILSDRPYRKGASIEAAAAEIARSSGRHFDPEVVAAFARVPMGRWMDNHRAFPELVPPG